MTHQYSVMEIPLELSVCSKSGWMKEELVVMWLKNFVSNFQSWIQTPHFWSWTTAPVTHFATPDFCKENGVIVASVPPHVSHKCSHLMFLFWAP
jgi:hypothetical protein